MDLLITGRGVRDDEVDAMILERTTEKERALVVIVHLWSNK
jgi:hypothetical protein